jgi:protein O-mannosyl-transferase
LLTGFLSMPKGFDPYLFNITAIILHLINIFLVYYFIRVLGKSGFIALITAALFGLATMQVESVAWSAAVFKTCIYSMFFLLSLILYVKYTEKDKISYILISLLLFLCSCLSKEQAVALSLAVIAIDYFKGRKLLSRKVIIEKIPYLLISLVFGIVTLLATRSGKEITVTDYSFIERLSYTSYAFVLYILKLFIPYKLSLFYPYPSFHSSNILFYVFPLLALGLIALLFYAIRKKNTWLVFGALFFLVNIMFSITLQVIAVRATFMADRYVYMACTGVFFMAAYGLDYLIKKRKIKAIYVTAGVIAFLVITGYTTRERVNLWKNSGTIMENVVKNYDFDAAYLNLGIWDQRQKNLDKAMDDYNNALRLNPKMPLAWLNRGCLYIDLKNDSLALYNIDKAEAFDPRNANIYSIRGGIYSRHKQYDLALKDFGKSLAINPRSELAYLNRGITYQEMSEWQKAIDDYNALIRLRPDASEIYCERGRMKRKLKQDKEALDDFNTAIKIDPNNGKYYLNRSYSYNILGEVDKALQDARAASSMGTQVDPQYLDYLQSKSGGK